MDDVIFYFSLDTALYSSPRKKNWFERVFSRQGKASSVCMFYVKI